MQFDLEKLYYLHAVVLRLAVALLRLQTNLVLFSAWSEGKQLMTPSWHVVIHVATVLTCIHQLSARQQTQTKAVLSCVVEASTANDIKLIL